MRLMCLAAAVALAPLASVPALAQLAGEPYIHDPSTVVQSDGKYFTFGTAASPGASSVGQLSPGVALDHCRSFRMR